MHVHIHMVCKSYGLQIHMHLCKLFAESICTDSSGNSRGDRGSQSCFLEFLWGQCGSFGGRLGIEFGQSRGHFGASVRSFRGHVGPMFADDFKIVLNNLKYVYKRIHKCVVVYIYIYIHIYICV